MEHQRLPKFVEVKRKKKITDFYENDMKHKQWYETLKNAKQKMIRNTKNDTKHKNTPRWLNAEI